MQTLDSSILTHLTGLYGQETGSITYERLGELMDRYATLTPGPAPQPGKGERNLSSGDALLITYGDQVRQTEVAPLRTLADFCEQRLAGVVSGVHLLPFFPYSSDDGFSVIDYRQVDPELGDWDDIARLGRSFRLMFDAVINHISAQSEWFKRCLQDDPKYRDYFIVVEGDPDLSQVVRPRALPLLTTFETPSGPKAVWTTFSEDQIDLNYKNPEVLLEIIATLLYYVAHGAEFIRLDAIAYLWKEIGTSSIHLPQTYRVIKLFRAVLDMVAPHVFLITETNVPHEENISYFGNGSNLAQMVYNFALPPMVLHSLLTGEAAALSRWAAGLELPSDQVTFFNFLASHDGIGLNPARGILSPAEIDHLVETVQDHGGLVSYKHNPDGTQSPYELNISYFDALSDPNSGEALSVQIDRFAAAHAIMFTLVGMPGIYFHSLFGSRSWREGVAQTGRNRTINRQKFWRDELEQELDQPGSLRQQVFSRLSQLLKIRAARPAFHPTGTQRVIECSRAVFALLRSSPDAGDRVLCLQNVSDQPQAVALDLGEITPDLSLTRGKLIDLITGREFDHGSRLALNLEAYQALWLPVS